MNQTQPELPNDAQDSEVSSAQIAPKVELNKFHLPLRDVQLGVAERQERTRGRLAAGLTLIFAFTVFLPLVLIFINRWAETKEWFQLVLPAVTALLGSARGFYFGSRNNG